MADRLARPEAGSTRKTPSSSNTSTSEIPRVPVPHSRGSGWVMLNGATSTSLGPSGRGQARTAPNRPLQLSAPDSVCPVPSNH